MWCGSTHDAQPGDAMLVPEGMPRYGLAADAEVLVLVACTSCLGTHPLADLFHQVAEGGCAQLRLGAAATRVETLLDGLGAELEAGGPWHELAVDGYLALLAATLRRAEPTPAVPDTSTLATRALAFIVREATRGISLVDVARHVHRSTAHTAAVVKADTGRTVVDWITHARLAAARQLLLRTDDTVEQIAARVGFASPSHFHRVFRRHHDHTPAAWRSAHLVTARSAASRTT
jgi:AraC-like DNA-binding protein